MNLVWNTQLGKHFDIAYNISNKTVLELGCNKGQFVAALHGLGIEAYGLDIDTSAIKEGHTKEPSLIGKTIVGSCDDLSMFEDNTFDFIYSQHLFERVPQNICAVMAKEMYRVAKPEALVWAGAILDMDGKSQPQGYPVGCKDKSLINIRPQEWWDTIFNEAGWYTDYRSSWRFNNTVVDGYSFYKHFGWHSVCYVKMV